MGDSYVGELILKFLDSLDYPVIAKSLQHIFQASSPSHGHNSLELSGSLSQTRKL